MWGNDGTTCFGWGPVGPDEDEGPKQFGKYQPAQPYRVGGRYPPRAYKHPICSGGLFGGGATRPGPEPICKTKRQPTHGVSFYQEAFEEYERRKGPPKMEPSFACPPLRHRLNNNFKAAGLMAPRASVLKAPSDDSFLRPSACGFTTTIRSLTRNAINLTPALVKLREEKEVVEAARKEEEAQAEAQATAALEGRVSLVPTFDPTAAARENKMITKQIQRKKDQERREKRKAAVEARKKLTQDFQKMKEERACKGDTVAFMGMSKWVPSITIGEEMVLPPDELAIQERHAAAERAAKLRDQQNQPWVTLTSSSAY